ncbi:hypothetical protein [Caballeronia sordidicola]|uniref:hypothetical protein n=1 Tax=Caballeronia sordidicola TaxID=196367 RepID=UPI000A3B4C89|nr:hypothetical protein [Caballeronia sordidicola]
MGKQFNPPKRNYLKQQVLKTMKELGGEVQYKVDPALKLDFYIARIDMDEVHRQSVAIHDILLNEAISDQERKVLEEQAKRLTARYTDLSERVSETFKRCEAVMFGCALRPSVPDRWLLPDEVDASTEEAFADVWSKISTDKA